MSANTLSSFVGRRFTITTESPTFIPRISTMRVTWDLDQPEGDQRETWTGDTDVMRITGVIGEDADGRYRYTATFSGCEEVFDVAINRRDNSGHILNIRQ